MPDTPVAHTESFANTEYDAEHRAHAAADPGASLAAGETNEPLPVAGQDPDVGLAQKGAGESAVVRRETDI